MKRLIERVVTRVSIVGLVFVSGCAALIGADFDKELEPDGAGGTGSGGQSALNTGGVITSSGGTSDGGSASGGAAGGTDSGGASTGGSAVGGGDTGGGDTGGSGAGGSGGSSSGGADTGGSGGTGTGGTVGTSAKIAINEVYGYDTPYPQFIELYNYGSLEYELTDHSITDSDGTGPKPPLREFGAGTVIQAGEYLLLEYDADFSFGITNEKYYLLDALDKVVTEIEYPDNVPPGSSYGRKGPNGTGPLQILSTPSPGEPN
jgi:hypothetical protein